MWPQLSLPKFTKAIATASLYISLWANWIGTLFVGVFGAGKEQYIVHQDLVPGATGFWNLATLLLINLSQLAVLTVVLAIIGFLGWAWTAKREKMTNLISGALFAALLILSFFQTFNPQYSNG
jgi:hydroxylaminobenzene mutase